MKLMLLTMNALKIYFKNIVLEYVKKKKSELLNENP